MLISRSGRMRCVIVLVAVVLLQMLMDIHHVDCMDESSSQNGGNTMAMNLSKTPSTLKSSLFGLALAASYYLYMTSSAVSGEVHKMATRSSDVLGSVGINIETDNYFKKNLNLESTDEISDDTFPINPELGVYSPPTSSTSEQWLDNGRNEYIQSTKSASSEYDHSQKNDTISSQTSNVTESSTTEKITIDPKKEKICNKIQKNILKEFKAYILPQVENNKTQVLLEYPDIESMNTKLARMKKVNCPTELLEFKEEIRSRGDAQSKYEYEIKDMPLVQNWAQQFATPTNLSTNVESEKCTTQRKKMLSTVQKELKLSLDRNSNIIHVDDAKKKQRMKNLFTLMKGNNCKSLPFEMEESSENTSQIDLTVTDIDYVNQWAEKRNLSPLIRDCEVLLDQLLSPWRKKIEARLAQGKTDIIIGSIEDSYKFSPNVKALKNGGCTNNPFGKATLKPNSTKHIYKFENMTILNEWLSKPEITTKIPTTLPISTNIMSTENDLSTINPPDITEISEDELTTMDPQCDILLEELLTRFSKKINSKIDAGNDFIIMSKKGDMYDLQQILPKMKKLHCPNYPFERATAKNVRGKQRSVYQFIDVEKIKVRMDKIKNGSNDPQMLPTTIYMNHMHNSTSSTSNTSNTTSTPTLAKIDISTKISTEIPTTTEISTETTTDEAKKNTELLTCDDYELDLVKSFAPEILDALKAGKSGFILPSDANFDVMAPKMQEMQSKLCSVDVVSYDGWDKTDNEDRFFYEITDELKQKYNETVLQQFVDESATITPVTL